MSTAIVKHNFAGKIVKRWPLDEVILDQIHQCKGVIVLVARKLFLPADELSKYIQGRPALLQAFQEEVSYGHANVDFTLRKMVEEGNLNAISVWLARQKMLGEGKEKASAGEPIDYTREVRDMSELTREELQAIVRREANKWEPESGEPCPCCGRKARKVKK